MKTIIIPTRFGFPTLDLYINGRKSTFKSGEEISVEDHIAEVIENAIKLEPQTNPSGYSKIATVTAAIGSNGYLPYSKTINADDNGKPFKIRDFFLTITTKLADSSAKKAYVQITGKKGEDIKCVTGYAAIDFSGDKVKKAWIRFSTFGQDGGGGGLFMVGETASEETTGLFGPTINYTGTHVTVAPTEPAVSLKEGIDSISIKLFDTEYRTVEISEGTKFELWGVKI